jgi:hypothetical protein
MFPANIKAARKKLTIGGHPIPLDLVKYGYATYFYNGCLISWLVLIDDYVCLIKKLSLCAVPRESKQIIEILLRKGQPN